MLLFLHTVKKKKLSHQSPSGPVHTRKTLQVFRIYKTAWFEHENTFQKLPGEKGYVYHPDRILDDTLSTIHGFPPCVATNKPHDDDQHNRNAPLKAHLRTLISPNR